MAMVSPYHTTTPENDPATDHRDVHHNQGNCPAGSRILPENRVAGTAGRPLCDDCKVLA